MDIEDELDLFVIGDAQQYLFFKAGGDIYAFDVADVSEMIEYQTLTKVPMMAPFVKGVTNIRGSIVPVIDLLERFSLGQTTIGDKTSLIIVDNMALIIDEVHDVSSIVEEDIKESLEFGFKIAQHFIKNMAKYNDSYIAILNAQEILNIDELSILEGD
ncbi:purine-binding chemotaxis protein CheW [Sulfurimonas sp. SAG-AH-194-C21]|nr:purine-binding chemotaxis protein CheW [Sulfurimonas sp. SAG-AH-194-C21]